MPHKVLFGTVSRYVPVTQTHTQTRTKSLYWPISILPFYPDLVNHLQYWEIKPVWYCVNSCNQADEENVVVGWRGGTAALESKGRIMSTGGSSPEIGKQWGLALIVGDPPSIPWRQVGNICHDPIPSAEKLGSIDSTTEPRAKSSQSYGPLQVSHIIEDSLVMLDNYE